MSRLSREEIRKRFESSNDFNEIFDTFEQALEQNVDDMELYRTLFWNQSLTPDELCMFAEKLVKQFPALAYETYMWLANVFEVIYSMFDNYQLAVEYYGKAAAIRPTEAEPYVRAADCYDPDLNIPPLEGLIQFLQLGEDLVHVPRPLFQRLSYLYGIAGDNEKSHEYRRKADEGHTSPEVPPPAP